MQHLRTTAVAILVAAGGASPAWAQDDEQEEPAEAGEQAEAPAPAAEVPPPSSKDTLSGQSTTSGPNVRINPRAPSEEKVFGKYRVRISIAKPKFDDGLEFYDKLYGQTKLYPTLSADWYAWDWYATLGLSFRLGYYVADGYSAIATNGGGQPNKKVEDIKESDIEKDKNSPTTLTLLPMQVLATATFTPFDKKWAVVDAYAGIEYMYFQEVRTAAGGGKAMVRSAPMMLADAPEKTEKTDDGYTNRGYKTSMVLGGAFNILLNELDEKSVASMRGSMGLGSVYMSPFLEFVRKLGDEGASFGRTTFGLGFTFESYR